jgi:hypothetical protein
MRAHSTIFHLEWLSLSLGTSIVFLSGEYLLAETEHELIIEERIGREREHLLNYIVVVPLLSAKSISSPVDSRCFYQYIIREALHMSFLYDTEHEYSMLHTSGPQSTQSTPTPPPPFPFLFV